MAKRNERTAADEKKYTDGLRREEPIKTEVIVELREQNKRLWKTQADLLESLLRSEAALRVYREQALDYARRAANSITHCVPGCTQHYWDHVDGWHRAEKHLWIRGGADEKKSYIAEFDGERWRARKGE